MLSLSKLFRSDNSSASIAKSRLQLVITRERIGLSESKVEAMKEELSITKKELEEFIGKIANSETGSYFSIYPSSSKA